MSKTTGFTYKVKTSSGVYDWSDPNNWSNGLPADGDNVIIDESVAPAQDSFADDDTAGLSLASLTVYNDAPVEISTGLNLSLLVNGETDPTANSPIFEVVAPGAPIMVTVGTITTAVAGFLLESIGTGATLVAQNDAGDTSYTLFQGATIEIGGTPSGSSSFGIDTSMAPIIPATFAFAAPAGTNAFLIGPLAIGDTIEVPGTSAAGVLFGAHSLSVTTSAGSYSFTNVNYLDHDIRGYSAAVDATTGLLAITFDGSNRFQQNVAAASGAFTGDYLWSDADNWSSGRPSAGADFIVAQAGYDDISALSTGTITLDESLADAAVYVISNSLTVDTLSGTGGLLEADAADANAPVTVVVDQNLASGATLEASGAGATLVDKSTTFALPNNGLAIDSYVIDNYGLVEVEATPPAADAFIFNDAANGTLAFASPGSVATYGIVGLDEYDTIEVPGSLTDRVTVDPNSVDIVTNKGSYDFTNVSDTSDITNYSTWFDSTTGLEAISFRGIEALGPQVQSNPGQYLEYFLWSNAENWLDQTPIDGDAVSFPGYNRLANPTQTFVDDIPALSLSTLYLYLTSYLHVDAGSSLTIGSLAEANETVVEAISSDKASPAVVTIGTVTGSFYEAGFWAFGAGATIVDESTTDAVELYGFGKNFVVNGGGTVELLSARPSTTTRFEYFGTDPNGGLPYSEGTIALGNPGSVIAAELNGVAPGDVLELPGTAVGGVAFVGNSLDVITNAGTYDFTNVSYGGVPGFGGGPNNGLVTGYTAAFDPKTELEAITFSGPDVFEENVRATTGPLTGFYLWSNPANWTDGIPVNGTNVAVTPSTAGIVIDDVATLSLGTLILNGNGEVDVTGNSLAVGTVSATAGSGLEAFSLLNSVTVTVDALTGAGGFYGANGAGARFIDLSTTDPSESYRVIDGGFTELTATPSSASTLYFTSSAGTTSTFALENPAATNAVAISGLAQTDVLELPGTAVSAVALGANSLSVTTSAGTYAFNNVTYSGSVTGYTAGQDVSTGLVAITFTGPDIFQPNVKATSGKFAGDYLWSNAANWSLRRAPIDGDSVSLTQQSISYDDIASLSLDTLTMNQAIVNVVGSVLNVGTVVGGEQITPTVEFSFLFADAADAGAPVTVTAGDVTGTRSTFGATGAGGAFVDNSPTDPGNTYEPGSGGTVVLAATQVTQSDVWYLTSPGTMELPHLASITQSDIDYQPDDVLELPGSTVNSVSFLGGDVTVVTDQGSYALLSDGPDVTGYRWTPVAGSTLVAVTFTGPDIFQPNVKATSGKFADDYLWSNAANWSLRRAPIDGDSVSLTQQSISYDDIASLSLDTLTMNQAIVNVVGSVLNVGTVVGGEQITPTVEFSFLFADAADAGAPVTVTAGDVTGTRSTYGATGAGGTFVDNSPTDPGNTYEPGSGGTVILSATQVTQSDVWYLTSPGTMALTHLASITTSDIDYQPDDVLELPGSTVNSVSFLSGDLTVVTDQGSYDLVSNPNGVTGYRWTPVAGTTLVAVTFTGPDTFQPNVKATSGKFAGDYLWSNAANWSVRRAPIRGDIVVSSSPGYDDMPGLRLATFSLTGSTEIGSNLTAVSVVNDGTIRVDPGVALTVAGALTGSGILIQDPSTIELDGSVGIGQTVDLVGSGNLLILGDPQEFEGTISNFSSGDVIDLPSLSTGSIISQSFVNNSLTLVETTGSITLHFMGSLGLPGATFSLVPGEGTDITAGDARCFTAGTGILTPGGYVAVEHLVVGDSVCTEFAGTAAIRWIGSRRIDCRRHPRPEQIWPVCVAAGAFGSGMPQKDVLLSPDHAVYLQGSLIPVRHLINGTSIRQVPTEHVTYYHVELPRHDVLRAEGLQAESYLDVDDRSTFDNGGAVLRLFPEFQSPANDAGSLWEAKGCAPLIVTGGKLAAARRYINHLAGATQFRPVPDSTLMALSGDGAGGAALR